MTKAQGSGEHNVNDYSPEFKQKSAGTSKVDLSFHNSSDPNLEREEYHSPVSPKKLNAELMSKVSTKRELNPNFSF